MPRHCLPRLGLLLQGLCQLFENLTRLLENNQLQQIHIVAESKSNHLEPRHLHLLECIHIVVFYRILYALYARPSRFYWDLH